MILEGIVTTVDDRGELNIAPMGITLGPSLGLDRFQLRPYPSSTTFRNLKSSGEGVFHITDDVLLLAQTAIGLAPSPAAAVRPAEAVSGWVLVNACRFLEFRTASLDESAERARIEAVTVREGRNRDFLGFNRARHAVLEAAILATRTAFLPRSEILGDLDRLAVLVEKTGGDRERTAFRILRDHVGAAADSAPAGPSVESA
ncbi:DUF447 domain-containing protein [Aquisphaera insulae]|uniref:DUF447 domain-containing protein n=1 Tax=Aquisphaera insulae TaxID=2712864 RepID=UPI0013ECF321|nr:DUF447 domain-containing protein [Aquisphaera insulae]